MRLTLALAVTLLFVPAFLHAQDGFLDREPQIKAAYLYQFVRYVQWPSDCFANPDDPLVIGTVGDDPVNEQLRFIARNRTAGQRRLEYRVVVNADQAARCHIVFVADGTDAATRRAIISAVDNRPVLLVGEHEGFVGDGGVITFIVADNRVRLRLSMANAAAHQLKISSQLAKLAEIVN